jgi:hypothetical protein
MEGGQLYGYCPAKATWDASNILMFNAITVTIETGLAWNSGGVTNQPAWWVDLCAAVLPLANDLRFVNRAKMILGDGKKDKTTTSFKKPSISKPSIRGRR